MSALTLVCFAVPQEAAPFQKLVRGRPGVRVLITGMGARHAERAAREAVHELRPARVFTCGFAGALDPALVIGDVVCPRETICWGAKPVLFHCASRVAITVAEKQALRAQTGADVVEMESAVITRVCHAAGVECVTLRAISDTADEDLPLDFNALMTSADQINWWKFARTIAFQPTLIGSLIAFQRQTRDAARQLGRVLNQVVKQRAPAAWRQGVP